MLALFQGAPIILTAERRACIKTSSSLTPKPAHDKLNAVVSLEKSS